MKAVFITGTGTDVGKTFVSCALIRYLRARGQKTSALKPVVSGFDPADTGASDPALLLGAMGRGATPEEIERISPWRLRAALSPDMAAQAEGRAIDFHALIDFCRAAIGAATGTLVIEGAGGIMVPLDERHTSLDLMTALGLPLILVGGSYLGTLSHILSAQEAVLGRGLGLRAIVVSESEGPAPPLAATLETLAHFARAPMVGLRRGAEAVQNEAACQRLAELIA